MYVFKKSKDCFWDFSFFYKDILKAFSWVQSSIADILMITSFIQSVSHQYQLQWWCLENGSESLFHPAGTACPQAQSSYSGRILFFKTKNTRVSLWPQAAANLHISGYTFQMKSALCSLATAHSSWVVSAKHSQGLEQINGNNQWVCTFMHP